MHKPDSKALIWLRSLLQGLFSGTQVYFMIMFTTSVRMRCQCRTKLSVQKCRPKLYWNGNKGNVWSGHIYFVSVSFFINTTAREL